MTTFLRIKAVLARTGLSRTTMYDLINSGDFPKPVPLAERAVGWDESEIAAWQAKRIAERDSVQAA